MARTLAILALLFNPIGVGAADVTEHETEEPAKCESCTARHKSLKALQEALKTEEKTEDAAQDIDAEGADD